MVTTAPHVVDVRTALMERFRENLSLTFQSNRTGDGANTLFSNGQRRGSRLTISLKLDRAKMVKNAHSATPLYFDFPKLQRMLSNMELIPPGEQLQFELYLQDDLGNRVVPDHMGTVRKRPARILDNDNAGTTHPTAEVRRLRADPNPRCLDEVKFENIKISAGVSSKFLYTGRSKQFVFHAAASNIDQGKWNDAFPNCDLPQATSGAFWVYSQRAGYMKKKRRIE